MARAKTPVAPPATPATPVTPAVPVTPELIQETPAEPVTPSEPATPELTQETPAEPVEELPRKINVIHKASQQKFEVSKDYYLRNKAAFELCR